MTNIDGLKITAIFDTDSYVEGAERIKRANERLDEFLGKFNTTNMLEQLGKVNAEYVRFATRAHEYKQKIEEANKAMKALGQASGEELKPLREALDDAKWNFKSASVQAFQFLDALRVMKGRIAEAAPSINMFMNKEQASAYARLTAELKGIGRALDEAIFNKDTQKIIELNDRFTQTAETLNKIKITASETARSMGDGISTQITAMANALNAAEKNVADQAERLAEAQKTVDALKKGLASKREKGDSEGQIISQQLLLNTMIQNAANAQMQYDLDVENLKKTKETYNELLRSIRPSSEVPMIFNLEELEKIEKLRDNLMSLKGQLSLPENADVGTQTSLLKEMYKTLEEIHGMEDAAVDKAHALGASYTASYSKAAESVLKLTQEQQKESDTLSELRQKLNDAEDALDNLYIAGADEAKINKANEGIIKIKEELHDAELKAKETAEELKKAQESLQSFGTVSDVPMVYDVETADRVQILEETIAHVNQLAANSTDFADIIKYKEELTGMKEELNGLQESAAKTGQELGAGLSARINAAREKFTEAANAVNVQKNEVNSLADAYEKTKQKVQELQSTGAGSQVLSDAENEAEKLRNQLHEARMELSKLQAAESTARSSYNSVVSQTSLSGIPKNIDVRVTADTSQFLHANDEMVREMERALSEMQGYKQGVMGISDALQGLAEFSIPAMTLGGLTAFLNKVKNVRAEMQDIESTMQVFLGEDKSKKFVSDLQDAAFYNMFEFKDLVEGSKQMIAYGVATDQVIDRLNQLSEIATATHAPLSEMVASYNRAKSLGFVDSRTMQSWATKGLVIKDVLKEMGENANVTKISFDKLNKVLDYATAEGGMFHGVMDSQMHNISAETGQLADNMTSMFNDIGKSIEEPLIQVVKFAEKLIDHWRAVAGVMVGAAIGAKTYKAAMSAASQSSHDEIDLLQKKMDAINRTKKELELDDDIKKQRDGGIISAQDADKWQNLRNELQKKGKLNTDLDALEKEAKKRVELTDRLKEELEARRKLAEEKEKEKQSKGFDDDVKEAYKSGSISLEEAKEITKGRTEEKRQKDKERIDKLHDIDELDRKKLAVRDSFGKDDYAQKVDEYAEARKRIDENDSLSVATEEQRAAYNQDQIEFWEKQEKFLGIQLNHGEAALAQEKEKLGNAQQLLDSRSEYLNTFAEEHNLGEMTLEDHKQLAEKIREQLEAKKEMNEAQSEGGNDGGEGGDDDGGGITDLIQDQAEAEEYLASVKEAEAAATEVETTAENINQLERKQATVATNMEKAASQKATAQKKLETVSEEANSVSKKKNTQLTWLSATATKVATTASTMFKNAVNQATLSIKALGKACLANPLGPILAVLSFIGPMLMGLFADAEEHAADETAELGKETMETKGKIEVLYAILKNTEKGTKAHTDALKELTKACKDNNIQLKDELDIEQQLIDRKGELIARIIEEGRQKMLNKQLEQFTQEKEKIYYGENGDGGVSKDIRQGAMSYLGVESEVALGLTTKIMNDLLAKEDEIGEAAAKLKEAEINKTKATATMGGKSSAAQYDYTPADVQAEYDRAKEEVLKLFNVEQLKTMAKSLKVDEDKVVEYLLYIIANKASDLSQIPELNKSLETTAKGIYSTETPDKPDVNKDDPEALINAYTSAKTKTEELAESQKKLEGDYKKASAALKKSATEAKKSSKDVADGAKTASKAADKVAESADKAAKSTSDMAKTTQQSANAMSKVSIQLKTDEVAYANEELRLTQKEWDQLQKSVTKDILTVRADMTETDAAKRSLDLVYTTWDETSKKYVQKPVKIPVDSSPQEALLALLGEGIDLGLTINDMELLLKTSNKELQKTVDKEGEVKDAADKINNTTITPATNNTQLLETLKIANQLYYVMNAIGTAEYEGKKLYFNAEDTHTMMDVYNKHIEDFKAGGFKEGQMFINPKALADAGVWSKFTKEEQEQYRYAFQRGMNRSVRRLEGGTLVQLSPELGLQQEKFIEKAGRLKNGKLIIDVNKLTESERLEYQKFDIDWRKGVGADYKKQQEEYTTSFKKHFDEGLKKGETTEYYKSQVKALTEQQAKLRQDDPLWDWIEKEIKKYQELDKSHKGNKGSDDPKQREYEFNKFVEQQKQIRDRKIKDNEFESRRFDISRMDDTTERSRMQTELDYEQKQEEWSRKLADEAKKIEEQEQQAWLKQKKGRKAYQWENAKERRSKDDYLKDAQYLLNYNKNVEQIEYDHAKKLKEIQDKEAADMRDYLKEYGSYKEKELAITQEWDEKIAKAVDEGARLKAEADKEEDLKKFRRGYTDGIRDFLYEIGDYDSKRQILDEKLQEDLDEAADNMGERLRILQKYNEDIAALDMEELNKDLNWEMVFGDIENYSTEALEKLHEGLRNALNAKDITAENAKVIMDQLDNLEAEMRKRKDVWGELFRNNTIGGMIMGERDRKQRYAKAQKDYDYFSGLEKKETDNVNVNRGNLDYFLRGNGVDTRGMSNEQLLLKQPELLAQVKEEEKPLLLGFFDNMAKSMKGAKDAKDKKDEADDAKKANEKGLSGFAMADVMVHGINDNVQSMLDLFDQFGIMDGTFGDGMRSFAESSQYATAAFDSLKNGDIMGVANNAINALGSLGDALGSWGVPGFGSSDKNLMHDLEELARVNEALTNAIQELYDEMADANFSDALDLYKEIKDDLTKSMEGVAKGLRRSAAVYDSGFLGIKGQHSVNKHVDDAMTAADWERISKVAGASVSSSAEFFSMTSEQMAKVANHATDLWVVIRDAAKEGKGEVADLMDQYKEYYKQLEELEKQYQQKMTDTSFDSVESSFKSMLMDMNSSAYDFANNFESMMRQAVINSMMSDFFSDRLKTWYEDFAKSMEGGLDFSEQEELRKRYDKIAQEALDMRNELDKTMGWTAHEAMRGSTAGGFATASQDSVDELNGRFTAIQIETSAIRQAVDNISLNSSANSEKMLAIVDGMSAMRLYGQLQLEELQAINKNTRELYQMNSRLEQIEKNTSTL